MHAWPYRLKVLGTALVWMLLGLHLPTLHELVDHGWPVPTTVRVATAALALAGVAFVVALLRTPPATSRGA